MAAKLARRARRQLREARTHRRPLPSGESVLPSVEPPDPETVWLFALLTRLVAWLIRFQWIYFMVASFCLITFWSPLVESNYTRRCNEHRAWLRHLPGPTNFTKRCTIESEDQQDDFAKESSFALFINCCCIGVAASSIYLIVVSGMIPAIEHIHRRRFSSNLELMFVAVIGSSLLHQVCSAFATRPLAMGFDLRFHSMFATQLFGFALCLFAAFLRGVKYASN